MDYIDYPWLMLGDCLERMKEIPDGSVDMILADLPYGTTACKWDVIIPFEPLWKQYRRILKSNGVVALFGSEPFSSCVRFSNLQEYKYDWIWKKDLAANFLNANRQPLKHSETISIFYNKQPTYNPQKWQSLPMHTVKKRGVPNDNIHGIVKTKQYGGETLRFPSNIIEIKSIRGNSKTKTKHPTQKPVALLEYLIKTHTNEGEIVLDNVMGSGSTGVACININRKFIGIEKDEKYYNISKQRIKGGLA